jgi:hypothetical protein
LSASLLFFENLISKPAKEFLSSLLKASKKVFLVKSIPDFSKAFATSLADKNPSNERKL